LSQKTANGFNKKIHHEKDPKKRFVEVEFPSEPLELGDDGELTYGIQEVLRLWAQDLFHENDIVWSKVADAFFLQLVYESIHHISVKGMGSQARTNINQPEVRDFILRSMAGGWVGLQEASKKMSVSVYIQKMKILYTRNFADANISSTDDAVALYSRTFIVASASKWNVLSKTDAKSAYGEVMQDVRFKRGA